MPVLYPLDLPDTIGMESITLGMTDATAISKSPFTFKTQVIHHGGQEWTADVSIPACHRDLAAPWVSFLTKLRGQEGTFLLGDPNAKEPRGTLKDSAVDLTVNGEDQTGETLFISGFPVNQSGVLLEEDSLQVGLGSSAQLYKVVNDVDSNSLGQAGVDVWPNLRSSPEDGAPVYYKNCVGLFRLSSNTRNFSINNSSKYGISFSATEAVG